MGSTDDNLFLQLSTAGLSCACSQTTVHWTETTMVRQQLAKKADVGNLYSMTARIARQEGVKALYRGYSAAMLRTGHADTTFHHGLIHLKSLRLWLSP